MAAARALAVCIGHFRIPSRSDVACLQKALSLGERCVLLVGSARRARSIRNPFTAEERAEMLLQALPAADRARVQWHGVREWWDDDLNRKDAVRAVGRVDVANLVVVRQKDEEDGERLPLPAGWAAAACEREPQHDTALLRAMLFDSRTPDDAATTIAPHLPEAAGRFLSQWVHGDEYARLVRESRLIAKEKAEWSVAPYPVVLVTVDAVVKAAGHVLLVRRGNPPGQGLWACPGGFLTPSESVLQGAVRELVEETQLQRSQAAMRAALRGVQVFDDPRRSDRGRIVTHAHHFDLGDGGLPEVRGGDDAAAAHWVPVSALASMQDQFVDDHFHILDRFLRLLKPPG
jgi:bifunctional NMN adenylyltransferase/nudix hydrolase